MKAVDMSPGVVSVERFQASVLAKLFTAEISDIPPRTISQLYSDACDVGFGITNPKTGQTTFWFIGQPKRDAEGEIQSWTAYPTPCSIKKFPALKSWRVTLFND